MPGFHQYHSALLLDIGSGNWCVSEVNRIILFSDPLPIDTDGDLRQRSLTDSPWLMASDSTFLSTSYHKYNTQENSQNTKKNSVHLDLSPHEVWFQNYLPRREERKEGKSSFLQRVEGPLILCQMSEQCVIDSSKISLSIFHLLPNEKRDLLQNCHYHIHLSIPKGIWAHCQCLKQWWKASQLDIVSSWPITAGKKKQGHFQNQLVIKCSLLTTLIYITRMSRSLRHRSFTLLSVTNAS